MLVQQILQKKGGAIFSVKPDETVYNALELMAEKNIGAVLVMENDELAGIFSERDYARKVILLEKSSKTTPVKEIMTSTVFCLTPQHSVDDCMNLISEKRIRHLPIMDDQRVIGVISIGDIVQAVIAQQASTIEHLENYITTGILTG